MGFTASGVAAGSMAAGLQATIGNVAAGTAFAAAQSLAATGMIATIGATGGIVLVAGGGYLLYDWYYSK